MKQTTAKGVVDVLRWIETNDHHYAAWDEEDGFLILKGRTAKLRIPEKVNAEALELVEPSRVQFDTRMFRASKKGRAVLRQEFSVSKEKVETAS